MELFNYRLILFADFIASANEPLQKFMKITKMRDSATHATPINVLYNSSVFELLPDCFDSWFFECNTGDPVIEGFEMGIGTIQSVFTFFNLRSCKEFSHLFDITGNGQAVELYGGKVLTKKSTLKDYAENLIDFAQKRLKN